MFGALTRGFRSMASLILVRNVVGELQPKRTLAASRGFLAAARLSCLIGHEFTGFSIQITIRKATAYFLSTLYTHLSFINCHNIARAAVRSHGDYFSDMLGLITTATPTPSHEWWLPSPIHQTSAKPTMGQLLKILSPPLFVANLCLWPVVQLNVSMSIDIDICMTGKRNSNHPGWLIHSFIIFFIMLTKSWVVLAINVLLWGE